MVPRRAFRISKAASSPSARRYGRSEVSASKQSTTERMRAPTGMSAPAMPRGYPLPSQFSWWHLTIGTTGYGKSIVDRMSAPTSTCSFIFSNSAGVSLPGLFRMCSGTASFPVSCSSAAASIALMVAVVGDAEHAGEPHGVRLDAPDVIVRHAVLRIDRRRQRLDRGEVHPVDLPEMLELIAQPADGVLERRVQDERNRNNQHQDDRVGHAAS